MKKNSIFYFLFSKFSFIILFSIFYFLFSNFVFASTEGVIDSVYRNAWGENIGWINFGCSHCNVRITDSAITGFAWSPNYGWINLSPTHGGIRNNAEGDLSGHAWAENLGWIDFDNVFINTDGRFTGMASSTIAGRINFDCVNCDVRTNWRPRRVRPVGVLMPSAWFMPPQIPEQGFRVLINRDARYTDDFVVNLDLFGGPDVGRMAISNNPEFKGIGSTGQIPFQSFYQWNLCLGQEIICRKLLTEELTSYEFKIYVKFFTPWGLASEIVSDSIIYRKEIPIIEVPEIIREIPEIIERIPEIFLPPKPPVVELPEIPIEELVPKEAPAALRARWQLLPREPVKRFVFAPLPKEFQRLVRKFPELERMFAEVGIEYLADIERLKAVRLILPGLAEKEEIIPSEVVFARTVDELIDFNIVLSVDEEGEVQQEINLIAGKPLQLVVRPDRPVESIRGYLIFRSREIVSNFKLQDLMASVVFASPSFVQNHNQEEIETRFVIMEFEYTDFDRDGIWTAEIQTPVVGGKYEIITVFDFKDPELGKREIRLITLIDPEGYIYKEVDGRETRIPGAIVSLYWLNPETKQYELWPAERYHQENPQITDVTGSYSFLVPEGFYFLKVEAPGFLIYEGKPFQVEKGRGVHINIELKSKHWWLEIFDWKTIVIIIFGILLLYNFYRDKIREKKEKKIFKIS